jgi:hypothetical protein
MIIKKCVDWFRCRKLRKELKLDACDSPSLAFVRKGHCRKNNQGRKYFVKSAIVFRDTRKPNKEKTNA